MGGRQGTVPQPEEEESCGTCRFWREFQANPEEGRCLRNPPCAFAIPKRTPEAADGISTNPADAPWVVISRWPVTSRTGWCGRHEQKPRADR